MRSFIEVKKLTYKDILFDINMSIKEASFIFVSGNNKCGKTTLLKILSGNIKTEDKILFNNSFLNSYKSNDLHTNIGIVYKDLKNAFIFETVEEEIQFVLDNLGLGKDEKEKEYIDVLKLCGLEKYRADNPKSLPRHLKIRLLLALEIVKKPKLLLLDDICSMLTNDETKKIMDILLKLKKKKTTIIMTTDNLNDTLVGDYLYILDKGKISLEGPALEVLENDNTINKIGLKLPFMIDLSLKLKCYDLVDNIELDMDRMVNSLWK